MATLTAAYYDDDMLPEGEPPRYLKAKLTYEVTTTETWVRVNLSKVEIAGYKSPRSISCSVKFGSTVMANWTGLSGTSITKTTSAVQFVDRTHNNQSKSLTISVSGKITVLSEKSVSDSASASISVPARPSYSVTYDANGGNGAPSAQTKWYDENLTLDSKKPTRTNYVFRRWNTNTSDTGTAYSPSASYTGNAALALYAIWNPVIAYDANGGSGSPSAQTKTFGQALTLQAGIPRRTGYTFLRWNTAKDGSGTDYDPSGTMAAGSNVAVTLYAQWKKNPEAPTISSITTVRSNSSGNADDSGTYCKVTAKWSIDTTNVSGNTATVTGTIKPEGGSAVAFTFGSGASGTSGTAVALIAEMDTDRQYTVTVTVTDTLTSTSRVSIMTRAFFIMDLKAGGNAMGIGTAAPSSGLEVGWATQFDENVTLLKALAVTGNLSVTGNLTAPQLTLNSVTSDVASASSGWTITSQSAYTYGRIVMVCVTFRPTSAVAANDSNTVGTLASGYRPSNTVGFCNPSGIGTVSSGGSCSFRNVVDLSTTSNVIVGVTFVK